jgi:hypothetical protein
MSKPAQKVPAGDRQWKRSWKNLLLNKRYQLRFTLFMVAVSALLVTVLGWWVMRKANEATAVAKTAVEGEACPKIPELTDTNADDNAVPLKLDDGPDVPDNGSAAAPAPVNDEPPLPPPPTPTPVKVVPSPGDVAQVAELWCSHPASCKPATAEPLVIKAPKCDEYVKKKMADPAYVEALRKATIMIVRCEGGQTVSVDDAPEAEEHHVKVQIDEATMTMTPTVPNDFADRVVSHWTCELRQWGAKDALQRGRMRILWVLIATGIALMLGLAFYGIKMTHRVAGPLFKVSLYLAKMRDGRFDKVYNLRKGDQLVEFYEHFKTAHAGVVKLEREDIDHVKAVIVAAEAAGCGDHEAVAELKKILERKEKSVE